MRSVIFDLGGVVLDWNPDAILEQYYADLASRAALKSAMFQHAEWLLMDRGVLLEADMIARLRVRTGRSTAELSRLLQAVRESLTPKPDTVALIETLARREVPLYCLSNMPATTFAYLRERYDLWSVFRGIVISGEIQMMKPEREIFDYLLIRYGLAPRDTIFIDDHQPNILAASQLGIKTVWFRDAKQCAAELEPLLRDE